MFKLVIFIGIIGVAVVHSRPGPFGDANHSFDGLHKAEGSGVTTVNETNHSFDDPHKAMGSGFATVDDTSYNIEDFQKAIGSELMTAADEISHSFDELQKAIGSGFMAISVKQSAATIASPIANLLAFCLILWVMF